MHDVSDYQGPRWWEALCDDLHEAGSIETDSSHDAADAIAGILRRLAKSELVRPPGDANLETAAETLEQTIGNASIIQR